MNKTKYILVQGPESQILMEQPWFNECVFCIETDYTLDPGSSAYMVSEDRYNEIYGQIPTQDELLAKFSDNVGYEPDIDYRDGPMGDRQYQQWLLEHPDE